MSYIGYFWAEGVLVLDTGSYNNLFFVLTHANGTECTHPSFAKNTAVSRIFGENSSKISASGGILGKDERVVSSSLEIAFGCANSGGFQGLMENIGIS